MALWPNNRRDLLGLFPTNHVGLAGQAQQPIVLRQRQVALFANAQLSNTSSIPEGAFGGRACVLAPLVAGGMAAANDADDIRLDGAANVLSGGPMSGAAAVSITASGSAALIVGLSGDATIVLQGNDALLSLTIGLDGAAAFSFTGNASNLGLIVPFGGAASISLTGTADLRGLLSLSGASTPYAELSPQNLAVAVWERIIEAGFTAEQILRLIAAHAAGAATGLEGSNPQFTGLDGITVRIDGTYSAGTRTIDALDGD
jgi:hypothetical protein